MTTWVVTCNKLGGGNAELRTNSLIRAITKFLKWYFFNMHMNVRISSKQPVALSNKEFYDAIYATKITLWRNDSGWCASVPDTVPAHVKDAVHQFLATLPR